MTELVVQNNNLPDNIQDLSKFVLVGREKLVSVRAEIRAIDKLEIAEEVRNQKREEAQMLAEALLDAEVRLGDLFKEIPKEQGKRTDFQLMDTGVHKLKAKKEIVNDLGFNEKQVQRFETLSNHKDIVEEVKAEARENEDIPTRSRVLQIVKEKSKEEKYLDTEFRKIEAETAIKMKHHDALYKILTLEVNEKDVMLWISEMTVEKETIEQDLDKAIDKLIEIRQIYRKNNQIRRVK